MDTVSDYVAKLDDFQVVAERHRLAEAMTALVDQYRALTQEMNRRTTLRWMLP